jgi:hypothetical protein
MSRAGDRRQPPEVLRAARVAEAEQRISQVVERVCDDIWLAGALAELQCLPRPRDRLVEPVGQRQDRRQVGVGAGEAAAVVEWLEQCDRARHRMLGPGGVVDHVEGPRQRDERLPERRLVAELLAELDDLAGARHRLVEA